MRRRCRRAPPTHLVRARPVETAARCCRPAPQPRPRAVGSEHPLRLGRSSVRLVESGKWLGKIFAPVNGELVESNEALETNAALINEDCYGAGWMYKIQPSDMADIKDLIRGPEAVEMGFG